MQDIQKEQGLIKVSHQVEPQINIHLLPIAKGGLSFTAVKALLPAVDENILKLYWEDWQQSSERWNEYVFPQGDSLIHLFVFSIEDFSKTRSLYKLFRSFFYTKRKKLKDKYLGFDLRNLHEYSVMESMIEVLVRALNASQYKLDKVYISGSNPEEESWNSASILVEEDKVDRANKLLKEKSVLSKIQLEICDLVNAPSNIKSPQFLAQYAKQMRGLDHLEVEVLEKDRLVELGMGGILAVNQASPNPPVFIILRYNHHRADLPHVGFVGKGVTFDTGGISLKRSTNMYLMKSDMGGGAAVMGAMKMVATQNLDIKATAIVPVTDNSIDKHAVKPSDIIQAYNGRSIEIIDTDAEGRLLLADGLSYMVKHYQPDHLIDIATLTGNSIRVLGSLGAAYISNSQEVSDTLEKASAQSCERVWRLPAWEEYRDMIKSDIADVKNFSGKPQAGTITAAMFVQHFISDHPNWVHIDIAGVAMEQSEMFQSQVATAYGVSLLYQYMKVLCL